MFPKEVRFAQDVEGLLSPDELSKLSGFDFINGMREGRLPSPPIAQTLGFWFTEVEVGKVSLRGVPSFKTMNPIGTVHGGWFGTLLDSCMACAFQTTLPAGKSYTTLEFKVNIVRPLFDSSEEVVATGACSHAGRRSGVVEGRMVGVETGKLYATGSTTCMVLSLSDGA